MYVCRGKGWGRVAEQGLHILLEFKEEGKLGMGGERGEEIYTGKDQPEKVILHNHSTPSHTNFQLYCHIPLLFFNIRISLS